MEITRITQLTTFKLRDSFLSSYYKESDPFKTLLARSTYNSKYCRDNETWTDTIRRVVEGNINLSHLPVSEEEGEMLFHLFWTMQALPPGRGLWTGGIPGIPSDARYNCWYTTLNSIDDWCWTANQLMLGGGVGVGLQDIEQLPVIAGGNARFAVWCRADHENVVEVGPNDKSFLNGSTPVFRVPDSREGWVEALRRVLIAAYEGKDLIVDVSDVRHRGLPIRTFGGVACGPGPLTHLLRSAWNIIRGAAGRRLTSVECLDITNFVGFCVKSGNVRRSALIVLGYAYDQEFRDAKKDMAAVQSHRHTSNNSLLLRTWDEVHNLDYTALVHDMTVAGTGEPGILNLPLVWKTDPGARGVNPCGEQALHDREACNLAEVFPAQFLPGTDPAMAFRLVTRYCLRQRLTPLLDSKSQEVGTRNMRVGVGIGGLCDFDWSNEQLASWYCDCRGEADSYAADLKVAKPITVTTVKPSGTISLLNGSSPGIHAPFAPHYIRRARFAINDPMVPALMEAGVPFEFCQYDQTGNTYVFSFPMKAVHTKVTVQTETIADQFDRQLRVQESWADNAVSSTLSFDPETEQAQTAALLKENVPHLKSTTCLPKSHAYVQAPYEAVSESVFNEMASLIKNDHPLVRGGEMGIDECATGACPTR